MKLPKVYLNESIGVLVEDTHHENALIVEMPDGGEGVFVIAPVIFMEGESKIRRMREWVDNFTAPIAIDCDGRFAPLKKALRLSQTQTVRSLYEMACVVRDFPGEVIVLPPSVNIHTVVVR